MVANPEPSLFVIIDVDYGRCEKVYSSLIKMANVSPYVLESIHDIMVEVKAQDSEASERIFDEIGMIDGIANVERLPSKGSYPEREPRLAKNPDI